ncbi:1-hydroxycarotenoid 3,4-desaturase [Roseovarius azorensis]|uniref:1-hydroxycarotenoid 3,4-desaturase n=1 Tax=Roseovarius azorensis TaxID=1287727 RepID=A0A1H7TE99_9RHOB|nr:1-hydroxycarotenoid 3,4-desaturase CrtD [Roseovarius azorensis]SEL82626.1 1-hydroxycarotenoid 3,4-desaturase [Roseovarius azorensis]
MEPAASSPAACDRAVIVGAGIAGLAAAVRLAHAGLCVTVLERLAAPGGKMRTLPSESGPIDAGPTVLTLRGVFEALFQSVGERLEDHVDLIPQQILARHFWPDGSTLDLHADEGQCRAAIHAFAGARAVRQFNAFCARARRLFATFDPPMMQAPAPSPLALAALVARQPTLLRAMAPLSTLAQSLARQFDDPRLAQLFGRYATYVGGSPYHAPALLSLIWQAEAAGVWSVRGGMHRLAQSLAKLATARGAEFHYNAHVARIDTSAGSVVGVTLADGTFIPAATVLFNGDPRALASGALGPGVTGVASRTLTSPRSLSAQVWAFAATPTGPDLAHHNIFFASDPRAEFDDLRAGRCPRDATIYVCAQDRSLPEAPPARERFEIILNAPPLGGLTQAAEDFTSCHTRTFQNLTRHGLRFDPLPGQGALTTPARFERMFPASLGSLYGQSPQGMMAALQRPRARTAIRGLYLAGGGAHPGAGVPMATLSARHAAEAILSDRTSTSTSRPMATHGGMSTV